MNYIVGLLGYSKVGKDEAGKAFLAEGFKRYAFGDEVKNELAAELGIPVEYLHDQKYKEKYRDQMVEYGEGKRKDNPNYWIDRLRGKIYADIEAGTNVVITDIRRVTEIEFISDLKNLIGKDYGKVLLIHIDRPHAELDNDTASNYAMNYAKRYNKIDFTIENKYDADILNAIVKYEIKHKIYGNT